MNAKDLTVERRRRVRQRGAWFPNRLVLGGVSILGLVVFVAVFAPFLSPDQPNAQDLSAVYASPSGEHLLGTDDLGRDVLSRVFYAARVSLLAALYATAIAVVLGVPVGILAGYRGGMLDVLLGRLADVMMSVPGLVLALTVITVVGPGLLTAMAVVGVVRSPEFFRLARSSALSIRKETFIEATIGLGVRDSSVMVRHVLPNAAPSLMVQATFMMGYAMFAEAALSFLGLGTQLPTPSWGSMLNGAALRTDLGYLAWGPGVAIMLTVLSFTLIGDGLRDAWASDRG